MLWLNTLVASINRVFAQGGLLKSPLLLLFLLSFFSKAQGTFQAGTHYLELSSEQAQVETVQPIQVQHWFWYGCPSCALFAQKLPLLQAKDLEWQTYPAQLRNHWYFHAKAYHFASQQDNAAELEQALFETLNQNGQALADQESLQGWFASQGEDADLVADKTTSPLLNQQLAQELALQNKWPIRGVPAVVIDDRYLVDASMVKSLDEFVAVIQFLLQQARQNRVPEQDKVTPQELGLATSLPRTVILQ